MFIFFRKLVEVAWLLLYLNFFYFFFSLRLLFDFHSPHFLSIYVYVIPILYSYSLPLTFLNFFLSLFFFTLFALFLSSWKLTSKSRKLSEVYYFVRPNLVISYLSILIMSNVISYLSILIMSNTHKYLQAVHKEKCAHLISYLNKAIAKVVALSLFASFFVSILYIGSWLPKQLSLFQLLRQQYLSFFYAFRAL